MTGINREGEAYQWIVNHTAAIHEILSQPFGACYGNEIAWSQAAAVQNTWYAISDTDMADGELNNITHDGSGQLTVVDAGTYMCMFSWAGGTNKNNDHIQLGISIDGTASALGLTHFESDKAGSHDAASGAAILPLTAGQTVDVALRTTDSTSPTITTDHLNFTLLRVKA